MTIQFQPPAMCRVANHQTGLPRATSSLALDACRDGASTASLGNLFQCVTALWVKNFLLKGVHLFFFARFFSSVALHPNTVCFVLMRVDIFGVEVKFVCNAVHVSGALTCFSCLAAKRCVSDDGGSWERPAHTAGPCSGA